jgi:hypothetical protein
MSSFTKYIAHINESLTLIDTVQQMSVTNIYALDVLMGLHLSSSARHERAYRDLMTYIDEGYAITLEQVMKIGLLQSVPITPTGGYTEL